MSTLLSSDGYGQENCETVLGKYAPGDPSLINVDGSCSNSGLARQG
jgi:hypothetical protein